MDLMFEKSMLTDEQKSLILRGIQEGKKEFQVITTLLPETITKKYQPFMLYDLVNTHVKRIIEENPHTELKVYLKRAGFHPYIVIHDTIRDIFILVLKLPKKNYIFNPSGYRGEFASSNFERLMDLGVPQEELLNETTTYQCSLPLDMGNQPFGVIVCYDSKNDIVYEGALRPDQEEWIYKEDISDYININNTNLVPLNKSNLSDIELSLKVPKENEDIVIKLKKNTSS